MITLIDKPELMRRLRSLQGRSSQQEFAEEMGISASYLSDIYRGYRNPGERILTALGLRRVERWEVLDGR